MKFPRMTCQRNIWMKSRRARVREFKAVRYERPTAWVEVARRAGIWASDATVS
jgi:hypothetical protein